MTIYVLRYSEDFDNAVVHSRQAFSSMVEAASKWKELKEQNKGRSDFIMQSKEHAISKYLIRNQADLVKVINEL